MERHEQGFTLIEVLLASFIFMSVVTIAIGSFTSQISLQSTTEAQRLVQQTAQSIIEAISRDIRTTEKFTIPSSGGCTIISGTNARCGNSLSFDNPSPTPDKRYEVSPVSGPNRAIRVCDPGDLTGCGQNRLFDPSQIELVNFRLEGVEPNANPTSQTIQPFVIIDLTLRTRPGRAEEFAEIRVRTMVTSRLFDKYR